jgi:hypothetical protein
VVAETAAQAQTNNEPELQERPGTATSTNETSSSEGVCTMTEQQVASSGSASEAPDPAPAVKPKEQSKKSPKRNKILKELQSLSFKSPGSAWGDAPEFDVSTHSPISLLPFIR